MDLDAAAIGLATKNETGYKKARELLQDELLLKPGKRAWSFVQDYYQEHGQLPPPSVVREQTGVNIERVEEGTAIDWVVDQLLDRHRFRALEFGYAAGLEHLEQGDKDKAAEEVHKLSDHLRGLSIQKGRVHTLAEVAPEVRGVYERTKRGETGVQFPWETMTKMTMGMWPGTLTMFVARPSVGKCVHEDTVITDPVSGVPRRIGSVYEDDSIDRVTSWSKGEGVHVQGITAKVDTGYKNCLRVTTRTGRSIVATPEHPFLTAEGWKRADEIRRGMTIASPSKMPHPEKPKSMKECDVVALAILLSQGSCTGNHVGFSTEDEAIIVLAQKVAQAFGVDVVPRGGCDYDFVRRIGSPKGNAVRQFLVSLGIDKKLSRHKIIPEQIFSLPENQLAKFLSIFWMCDGYVSKRGEPEITLASKEMIYQIQSLLLRFGVQSTTSYKKAKISEREYDSWRLRVHSECVKNFSNSFSLWGEKAERVEAGASMARGPNIGYPRVSDEEVQRIKEISKGGAGRWKGGLHEKVAEKLGRSGFCTRDLFGPRNSIKMTAFRGFCNVFGVEDEFKWWWDSNIFWDQIVAIEEVGEQKIYDLTVQPTSCFVANDLIVHNTWTMVLICLNAAFEQGKKVLLVSPEMNRVEMAERFVVKHGGFNYGDVVSATLGMYAEPQFFKTIEDIEKADEAKNLFILDDEDKLEPDFIEEAIDATEADLVGIDSAYMLKVAQGGIRKGPGSRGDRQERMVSTVDWMRSTSRKKQKPFCAISQLARTAKVKKSAKETLKKGLGTGGLEDALAFSDTLYQDCVPEGSLVYTPSGAVPIESLSGGGEIAIGDTVAPAKSWPSGQKNTLSVELDSGFAVRMSPEHKVWALAGGMVPQWVRSEKLMPGDWVFIQRDFHGGSQALAGFDSRRQHSNEGDVKYPDLWSEELAELLGYIIGNGSVRQENRVPIGVDPRDADVARWLVRSFSALFGIDAAHKIKGTPGAKTCDVVEACSVGLVRYLRWLGVPSHLSKEKIVPERLWSAPHACRLAFVRGLLCADGHITSAGQMFLTTASRPLGMGVGELLRMAGFSPKIRCYDGVTKVWLGRRGTRHWMETIGLLSVRKTSQLLDAPPSSGRYVSMVEAPEHHNFALEQIRAVRDVGMSEMWDLTVEHNDHRFLCHGLVVHNCHNLFALYQDDDMKLDKQMLFVPLKARRQAVWSAVVSRWDMDEMNFDEIGTSVVSDVDDDDEFDDKGHDLVY